MALTRRRAAIAANKVLQNVALGLLYKLIPVTQFSNFLKQIDVFLRAGHTYDMIGYDMM